MRDPWEAEIWVEPKSDVVYVKVRQNCEGPDGQKYKRGVIIPISDEALFNIAEGMEYPHLALDNFKWERIFEKA